MSTPSDYMTTAELLETAERLYDMGEPHMYRACVLEAITALEANVKAVAFPALIARVGDDLAKWLEEKTRMDFDTRLGMIVPIATGLKVDKNDKLWNDYKKAKEIRNKVTHAGTKVTSTQARFVINTVYEWIEYLKQAKEGQQDRVDGTKELVELLGRFIQASARLERVVYSAIKRRRPHDELSRRRVYPLEELHHLGLVDQRTLMELLEFRELRNRAVHSHRIEAVPITSAQVKRLNQLVDDIEGKI
jgi:hypothetical protein